MIDRDIIPSVSVDLSYPAKEANYSGNGHTVDTLTLPLNTSIIHNHSQGMPRVGIRSHQGWPVSLQTPETESSSYGHESAHSCHVSAAIITWAQGFEHFQTSN